MLIDVRAAIGEEGVELTGGDYPTGRRPGVLPPPLPAAQMSRALELASWSSLDLGWRVLGDPNPAARSRRRANGEPGPSFFYFNVWTARTIWTPTEEVRSKRTLENQRTDLQIPGSLEWVRGLVDYMAALGIELLLWRDTRTQRDFLYDHPIRGRTPCLLHLLFYAHVLVNEFAIYPRTFLRALGLQRIVLVDGLAYDTQSRAAIPLVETGTLLLDPKLEEIVYVVNVLHHELFHILDCNMIWRADNHERKRRAKEQEEAAAAAAGGTNHRDPFDDDDWDVDREFDFETAMSPEEACEPLAPHCLHSAASLHGVPDLAWSRLNDPSFVYGPGGAASRGQHMFLTLGVKAEAGVARSSPPNSSPKPPSGVVLRGFLNGYSQTAVEEDKAELYASLLRAPRALLDGVDPVLASKAREMQRRLRWFCSELDETFWRRIERHTPHRARPVAHTPDAAAHAWIEKVDHAGHRYFFNTDTRQTSWVRPHGYAEPGDEATRK